MGVDLEFELEFAEENLKNDIQALSYIQELCETTNPNEFMYSQSEIKNQLEQLLKSMLYNQISMQKAIEKYNKRKEK